MDGQDKLQERQQEKLYLYWLCQIPTLGAVTIKKLWEHFQSFAVIYNIEETALAETGLLKNEQLTAFRTWKRRFPECTEEYQRLGERGIRFITPLDEEYPLRLRELYDAPMGLYVKGRLPDERLSSVAIVGARGCSAYGKQAAEVFARELAREQVQIISGLADGIDGAAHRGALSAGQATFGVLGCGVNICYPSSNYPLFEAMVSCGGVISEYPPGEKPLPKYFPMRNRIISGLADVVLVVEARERSGSLITAELGLEQGKEVYAVPGRITDALSVGCNRLIEQGAGCALSPGSILDCLGLKYEKKLIVHEKNVKGLAKKEKMVYSCLDLNPKHLDEIASACGLDVRECMGILLGLELAGYAVQTASHYYGKNIQK